jgi:hypothetical protein
MKQSVQQRLRKLEQDFMRVRDKQGRTPLEALLERRKRRLEANGEIYVEPPPIAPGIKGRNNCRDSAVSLQNTRDRTAALGLGGPFPRCDQAGKIPSQRGPPKLFSTVRASHGI